MPTVKPRVAGTLEPHTHEVIERLSVLQGRTRGAVIAELLDSVAPVLARTVSLLEAASSASEQVKQGLRNVAEGIHVDLVAAAGPGVGQLDFLLESIRTSAAGEVANPHVVTRGSGTGVDGGRAQRRNPAKPLKPGVSGALDANTAKGVKDAGKKR